VTFPVKSHARNFFSLFGLSFIIISAGYLIQSVKNTVFFQDLSILTLIFTFFSLIALYVFYRGQTKEPPAQSMHTLFSFSIKFLLELILALLWFLVAKKTHTGSVIMFFVLYLTFSLFLILTIIKALKNRPL
jgi:hypothetical protein